MTVIETSIQSSIDACAHHSDVPVHGELTIDEDLVIGVPDAMLVIYMIGVKVRGGCVSVIILAIAIIIATVLVMREKECVDERGAYLFSIALV